MTHDYTAIVELDAREGLDHLVLDFLHAYSPAVRRSALGNTEVVLTVPARDFTQLAQTTLAILASASDAPVLRIELMTAEDHTKRLGIETIPELVSVTDAARVAGVSRQAVLQRLEAGTLAGTKTGNTWVVQRRHLEQLLQSEAGLRRHARGPRAEELARQVPRLV